MSRLLGKVEGEGYESQIWLESWPDAPSGRVWFVADEDNDADGGSNPDGDPDYLPDTALHYPKKPGGKPIDAETVPGIVVPGWLVKRVAGIVLGCKARITNLRTMQSCDAVVHDTGPKNKNGEATPEAARRIGVNPNAKHGGEGYAAILYEFWPGIAAEVDGILYELQQS